MEFTYTTENNEVTITEYTGNDKNVVIPEMIENNFVVYIGDNAFKKKELTSILK